MKIKTEIMMKNNNTPPGKKPNKPKPLNKYKIRVKGNKIIIDKRNFLLISLAFLFI